MNIEREIRAKVDEMGLAGWHDHRHGFASWAEVAGEIARTWATCRLLAVAFHKESPALEDLDFLSQLAFTRHLLEECSHEKRH